VASSARCDRPPLHSLLFSPMNDTILPAPTPIRQKENFPTAMQDLDRHSLCPAVLHVADQLCSQASGPRGASAAAQAGRAYPAPHLCEEGRLQTPPNHQHGQEAGLTTAERSASCHIACWPIIPLLACYTSLLTALCELVGVSSLLPRLPTRVLVKRTKQATTL